MKYGMICGWSEDDFKFLSSRKLEAAEFCINGKVNSADFVKEVPDIKKYSEQYNIAVGSMGRWGMKRIDENGNVIPEALEHDKNLIDAASALGCPVYNVGCNYTESKSFPENCDIAIGYFGTLIDYAKGKNVKISVYNCDWENFVTTPDVWQTVLGALPELGIKYDTSHCRGRRGNYLKEMRDWGERIYHFHVKGTLYIDGEGYDDPPAGLDEVNWGAVFEMLYTKGYNGMISIEPHSGKWNKEPSMELWGIDFSINYIRPYVKPDNYGGDEAYGYRP